MAEQTTQTTESPGWVQVQKKTFTKWLNSHLRKKGFPVVDNVETDFETGTNLMNLINALYGLDIPKHNKAPKMRPHKLDNIALALNMVDQAKIKTNFLKSTHLADHDLKMILGMIWAIILDFQIKGISVEEMTAKEGLLLWCKKKTAGYRDVNMQNFTSSWTSGLAFCALIHRHRPDLLDYDPLDKANAKQNLELAFRVAEEKLGIPRLLDPEDLENPDERSVMTYVSEYFHCFASLGQKENAARRVKKFSDFQQGMEKMEAAYENDARDLLNWINTTIEKLNERNFADTSEDAKEQFENHKRFLATEKPQRATVKLDLEATLAAIQTKLQVYSRVPYRAPDGLSPEDIDAAWDALERAERERGKVVREYMFKFIQKAKTSIDEDQLREIESSFAHFDKDHSGMLDRVEFKAALQALGIPFKDENAFNELFNRVSEGNDKISKEQFMNYMISIYEDKDNPEQIKASFRELADQDDAIVPAQLRVHPIDTPDIDYLTSRMPPRAEKYDYNTYTDSQFL